MMAIRCDFSGITAALREAERRCIDPTPVLKQVGREWNQAARAKLKGGGFAPLATSTVQKRQHTGTSKITKHGNIRASYSKYLDREAARMRGLIAWAENRYLGLGRFAIPADIQTKVGRWRKRLENVNKQIVRAQDTEYADRRTGKSQAERQKGRPLLGKISTSMFYEVKNQGREWLLLVASHIGWAGVHNDGGVAGHGAVQPERRWLEMTQGMADYLAVRLRVYITGPLRKS